MFELFYCKWVGYEWVGIQVLLTTKWVTWLKFALEHNVRKPCSSRRDIFCFDQTSAAQNSNTTTYSRNHRVGTFRFSIINAWKPRSTSSTTTCDGTSTDRSVASVPVFRNIRVVVLWLVWMYVIYETMKVRFSRFALKQYAQTIRSNTIERPRTYAHHPCPY